MNETTPYDRIRDRELGRLAPLELERLERELAADPALCAWAEQYRLVHRLTELLDPGLAEPGVSSRTSYPDLERRLEAPARRSLPRRAAAAAVLVLVAGAAFVAGWTLRPDSRPLMLSAIELDEPLLPATMLIELPSAWADYDPRGPGGVRFLSDLAEAERLAGASGRPLLVYGSYPGCVMCAALDAEVFSDPSVIELAERTVPVRIDLAGLSQAEQDSFVRRGYPFLEMWRDDGRTTFSLARKPDPDSFVESLHDGLAYSDATGEQPSWEEIRGWVRRLLRAQSSEQQGRLAEAERDFRELSSDPGPPTLVRELAVYGLARLSAGARALLLDARSTAETDLAEARRLLELACQRYAGTSYETDFGSALDRLERDGRFPVLVERDRSA